MYTKTVELMLSMKDPLIMTEDDLHDVKLFLVEKYAQNGNRARFAAINAFCKHVLKREDLHLKIPGPVIKNKDIFTNEQIGAILAVAKTKNKLAFAILQTLYHCGLRKMELCNLNLSNLNFETMELTLNDTKTGNAVVAMTNAVGQALQDYIQNERRPRIGNEHAVFLKCVSENGLFEGTSKNVVKKPWLKHPECTHTCYALHVSHIY
jgi:integrase